MFTKENITPEYLSWLNDTEVVKYSNQRFKKHTIESSVNYLESFLGTNNLFLAIYLKEKNIFIGTMTVYLSEPHETADMAILIGKKSCWGSGVGLDSWVTVMEYLFRDISIRKITSGTLDCNLGMLKVMQKSGMIFDGLHKKQELFGNQAHDIIFYSKFNEAKYNEIFN